MATDFDVIPALYLQTYLAFVRRTVIQKMLYPIVDHCASVFPSHTVIEILQSPGIWRWLSGFQFHMWVESVQIGDNLIRQRKNHWYQLFTYNLKRATLALSIPSLYHFHPLSNSGKSCSSQAVTKGSFLRRCLQRDLLSVQFLKKKPRPTPKYLPSNFYCAVRHSQNKIKLFPRVFWIFLVKRSLMTL